MRSLFLKRIIDLTGAVTLLILAAPVMLVTALLLRWKMGSPVLFRQARPGFKGRLLTLNKFRTMRNAVESDGSPLPDNQRLTRLGRVLRGTSLDELPELWNVLKGDMSLVGPRPLLIEHLDLYTREQHRRHDVKPGLTGWAQVNGRDSLSWEKKLALDVWYVDNWNLWLDVKILCLTVWTVLGKQGVIHPEDATMSEFLRSRGGVEAGRSPRPANLNADCDSRREAA
ncbi:MAG: sugar transferase [Planctomycetota bacterium]